MKRMKAVVGILAITAGLMTLLQPCLGQTWVGTDNFSSGLSTNNWPIHQDTGHGQMTVVGTNGHASFLDPISTTDEQSAVIIWHGTPTVADDWTIDILGHNAANWSTNGGSQLQLTVTDETLTPVGGISMACGRYGNPAPQFHAEDQTAPATSATFGMRLVHRSGATGAIESWYDPKGDGTGWTLLCSFNLTNTWPGASPTNTFLIAIDADTYYGPIVEGDIWATNFRITNSAIASPLPQLSLAIAFQPTPAIQLTFANLILTTNYQLQVSGDLNTWTNQGSTFTATNSSMVYPQYFDVDNWRQLFFRLQVSP
jgi:hypothetical protein